MRTDQEINAEVRRQAQDLAWDRFDFIQEWLQVYWPTDAEWPFRGGDYPWLCALAARAIAAGLLPEFTPEPRRDTRSPKVKAMKLIIDRGDDRAPIEVLPDVERLDLERYVDRAVLIAALAQALRTGKSGFTEQEIKEMFSGGAHGR